MKSHFPAEEGNDGCAYGRDKPEALKSSCLVKSAWRIYTEAGS